MEKKKTKTEAEKALHALKLAAARQARWRARLEAAGLVRKTFTIGVLDEETFLKMAAASRSSAALKRDAKLKKKGDKK